MLSAKERMASKAKPKTERRGKLVSARVLVVVRLGNHLLKVLFEIFPGVDIEVCSAT